ncbi:glycosyltransferase [Nesterenkonia lutea]|uniref:Glycosyltransferase involved in cell wall biosynthesis n=1 Tax=Nesterenkonia lutea TaxID=272919 RepID=A0ABR9JCT1_9MICC|nr:glycosyltransferase [Nesterenkonia lutea]MBE1523726.1 glycosyltransferase involved in cell wall biosynthesis [Nesterenkonia lutea]
MRWIDLHPSASSSDFGETDPTERPRDADVLGAAFAMHRTALRATEDAHRAAARAWESTDTATRAATLRNRAGAAHLARADSYRQKSQLLERNGTVSSQSGVPVTRESIRAVAAEDELGPESLPSPRRIVEQALDATAGLPSGETGVSRPRLPVRVGLLAGPRLESGFLGAADILSLTSEDWAENLEEIDLLIVGSETSESPEVLEDAVIPACQERTIPTVFFSTASGDDVDATLGLAEACDWVFAVDQQAMQRYRQLRRNPGTVETVRLPISPLLHTPVGTRPGRTDLVALFGVDQSPSSRQLSPEESTTPLFDGVLASGRSAAFLQPGGAQGTHRAQWAVPTEYAPWTLSQREMPELTSAEELARLQRGVDAGMAVNAVLGSQTLVDSQVLQLQASGTMVLSTYNQGVNSYYPNVHIANSAEDVAKALQYMTTEELRRVQGDGIRRVFRDHHGTDVLTRICRTVGVSVPAAQERVLVVTDELTAELASDIKEQTHPVVASTSWSQLNDWQPASSSAPGDYDILMPMSAARRYSPFYAEDHVAAFRYQGIAITTKLTGPLTETDELAHQHSSGIQEPELTAWWQPGPEATQSPEALRDTLLSSPVYAIDHLGHRPVTARRTVDALAGSDFEESKREFRSTAESLGLELAVVVPIFNNGDHLRHKAFASLRRSEMFDRMHVLLINDGSSDASTLDTIEELTHSHPNVSAFHHAAGGSGSASRPRNTGLELSFTEFVTYLDPDDEELDDGYLELLEALRTQPRADFALGNMAVWTHRYTVFDYHAWFLAGVEHRDGLNWPHPQTLRTVNFRPASIEALVARTGWLKGLGLVQPVGAVGQDTYFFQQLMYYATAYVPVYRPVYTYYGAVDTSIVNVVSPNYFRKYLILETARADWLREVGLLDDYMEQRFEAFFVSWYLDKFDKVHPHQRAEAAEILHQIADAYGPYEWSSPRARAFFTSNPDPRTLQPA